MKYPRLKNLSPAYKITGLYLLLGLLWILFSDMVLAWFIKDLEMMRMMQTFKGWFYVIVTGIIFFLLINRSFKRLDRARESLREAVVHYSYLFQNNPHPMWTFDCNASRIIEVNEAAVKTYGYSEQEFLQLNLEQLHDASDLENLAEILACDAPEFNRSSGFRHRRKDGNMIDVELITHCLPGENNHSMRLVSALDITGRKQAFEALKASELALKESERQLSTLMSNLPGMAYRCLNDQKWTMLFVSKGCMELTGYPAGVIENNSVVSFGEIIHPADQQRVWDEVQEKLDKKMPYTLTYRIIAADGKVKWVWEQGVGVFDKRGELLFFEGFISDITEQRIAERTLKDNNELLRSILDNLPFPMFYKSLQGYIMGCNKAFCEYLGKPYDQILGRSAWDLIPAQKAMIIDEVDQQVLSTMSNFRKEEQLVFADGRVIDSVYQKSLFFDAEGIPRGFIGLYFDITERVRAEKIIQKQVMDLERINAELEQFTYTVSHDLRSPLVTIKGSLKLLYEDIRAHDEAQIEEGLSRIASATQRMHNLLEDLLQLSRIGRIGNPFSRFSMNELLGEVKHYLHGILAESGATMEVEADLPEVFGDRTRISEVFQNLLENAVKFRNPDRDLLIRIGCRRDEDQHVFFIQDNGRGIEPGQLNQVFGLFKKLDPDHEGTGIGLTVVKRIIEHHGGRVWAESDGPGHGATFCFILSKRPVGEN
ncbi:MAG: PAS domain S-box protein [Bacteroides sp.]|jgi:PAS domain S-box-containing protein|nr:PAS domain S-box protein [Bacteroides sp.]